MTSGVQNVLTAVHEALSRASGSLLVRDAEFGETLRIGQIIKGRVMRQYDGGRYLVDFSGQEKVVDSTIPLRTSELFNSRVVALGDQVHLQRLHDGARAASDMAQSARTPGPPASALHALFAEHNATLAPTELSRVTTIVRGAANSELMGLSALLLNKMGLPLSPKLLQALYRRLDSPVQRTQAVTLAAAPRMAPGAGATSGHQTAIAGLAETLHAAFGDVREAVGATSAEADGADTDLADGPDLSFGDGESEQRDPRREWELGQWLLGLQTHPRIAHRLLRVPIWFGDELLEVSIALFSEAGDEPVDKVLHYRRIVFFIATERLGQVQITVNAAERHLRLEVAADNAHAADALSRNAGVLQGLLETLGWTVDEMQYLETELGEEGAVLNSVVRHHIAQDSLSRLM